MTTHPILLAPYDILTLPERAEALILARDAGRKAGRGPIAPDELERAHPREYWLHVVAPAVEAGETGEDEAEAWQALLSSERALADPRVNAFLFGWHEAAVEVLAELESGRVGPEEEVARTLWMLDAVLPPEERRAEEEA